MTALDSTLGAQAARPEAAQRLARRVRELDAALDDLESRRGAAEAIDRLARRVHAAVATARLLGFTVVTEVLGDVHTLLSMAAERGELAATDSAEAHRALHEVGGLLEGDLEDAARNTPVVALVAGSDHLARAVAGTDGSVQIERSEDPARVVELALHTAPDVIVVDGDRPWAPDLVATLGSELRVAPTPVVVVATLTDADAAARLLALGVWKAVRRPASPETLHAAAREAATLGYGPRTAALPLGDVTVAELAERLGHEVQRGLPGSLVSASAERLTLGEGRDLLLPLWTALARVRELVTLRSAGRARFAPTGPEGALTIASWELPERREAGRRAGTRGAGEVSFAGRTVLVADDDPAVVWFLAGVLRDAGATVVEAFDGQAALDKARTTWPDVVLSDVLMPGLDGYALCRAIKRDPVLADLPVVLLSWKEDLLQRVRELGAGADGYLRKEAQAPLVLARVAEVLAPRARVEARLAAGGETRGRLAGLGLCTLISLVRRRAAGARITVKDASTLYELHLRAGALCAVSATWQDGEFERGEPALRAALGARDGRFVVTFEETAIAAELAPDALDRCLAEQRACAASIDALALPAVTRLELAPERARARSTLLPPSLRAALDALMGGALPRDVVAQGLASYHEIEVLLADLVAAGALVDLAPRVIVAAPPAPAPAVVGSSASDGDGFSFDLSPSGPAGEVAPSPLPFAAEPGAEPDPDALPRLASPQLAEPTTLRGVGGAVVQPRPAAPLEPTGDAMPQAPLVVKKVVMPSRAQLSRARQAPLTEDSPAPLAADVAPPGAAPAATAPRGPSRLVATLVRAQRALGQKQVRVGALIALSAALAYVGVSRAVAPAPGSPEAVAASPVALDPSTLVAPVTSVASPARAAKKSLVTDLQDPPPGALTNDAGGLLEISSGAGHAVYVDGVFVGRGPTRRIPVAAGHHDVALTLDGETITSSLDVPRGKRVVVRVVDPAP